MTNILSYVVYIFVGSVFTKAKLKSPKVCRWKKPTINNKALVITVIVTHAAALGYTNVSIDLEWVQALYIYFLHNIKDIFIHLKLCAPPFLSFSVSNTSILHTYIKKCRWGRSKLFFFLPPPLTFWTLCTTQFCSLSDWVIWEITMISCGEFLSDSLSQSMNN